MGVEAAFLAAELILFVDVDVFLDIFFFVLLPADDEDDDAFGADGVFAEAALTAGFAAFGERADLVDSSLTGAAEAIVVFVLAGVFVPLPASSEGATAFLEDALLNASMVLREMPNAGTHELSDDGYLVRTNSKKIPMDHPLKYQSLRSVSAECFLKKIVLYQQTLASNE